jgi:hypothetical protein
MRAHSPEDIYKRNIVIYFITEIGRSLIFTIPVWVAYELQYITLAQLPIIEAIMLGMQLVLELPTGALADLIGKKWTVFFGNVSYVIALVIYVYARRVFLILLFLVQKKLYYTIR